MPDKPISPLRQRMIDDMTAPWFSGATQKDYVRNVSNFTTNDSPYPKVSPDPP
jgi:hypothetical protein